MSATIALPGGDRATLNGFQWSGDDPLLVELLQAMLPPLGPAGSDPDPDLTAATEAAERLGGKVIRATERSLGESPAGVAY